MKTFFTFILALSVSFAYSQELTLDQRISQADQFIEQFQFAKALQILDVQTDSISLGILQRKGQCYHRLGNYGQAIAHYEKILSIDSTHKSSLFQLAQLYSRNNQFEKAHGCYQTLILNDSTNSYYYKQYGLFASQTDNVILSIAQFQQALKYNPKDVESYIQLGNSLLEIDLHHEADSVLTVASTYVRSPQVKLLLAKAQLGLKKFEDVIETTTALMETDTVPEHARLLGVSYYELEKYDQVLYWMKFLLKNDIKGEWVHYYMGYSFKELNQPDSAVAHFNMAIEKGISDNISTYYSQLASTYESMKDFKSAIRYYKAAYESSKANILLYHLARSYDVYYKDKTQAINYYKRYLNSDDTIKIAKEYTKYRLDQLDVYR